MTFYEVAILSEDDIYIAVSTIQQLMEQQSFSKINQQKVIVSVLELTRNILDHGGGKGLFSCQQLGDKGISFQVTDQGRGIANIDDILNNKSPKSSNGLGLGLAGAKRLMDEFHINSSVGGTTILAKKWSDR